MSLPGAVPHSPNGPPGAASAAAQPTAAGPPTAWSAAASHDATGLPVASSATASHDAARLPVAASHDAARLPVAASHDAAGLPIAVSHDAAGLPEWERLRVLRAEAEFASVRKETRVAYALWCVVGLIGGHRFYLGDTGRSIAMLFTLGGFGVWWLLDVFFVARRVRTVNRTRRAAIMARHGLIDA